MARGWPACTGARRHSNTYSARSALSYRAPPRVCCKPYPPLESIKGEGKELSKGDDRGKNEIDTFLIPEINISSNTPFILFL
jgi:hypothetical protein